MGRNPSLREIWVADRIVLQRGFEARRRVGLWRVKVKARRHGMDYTAFWDEEMAANALSRKLSSVLSPVLKSLSSCTASSICVYESPCLSTIFQCAVALKDYEDIVLHVKDSEVDGPTPVTPFSRDLYPCGPWN